MRPGTEVTIARRRVVTCVTKSSKRFSVASNFRLKFSADPFVSRPRTLKGFKVKKKLKSLYPIHLADALRHRYTVAAT